MDFPHFFPVTFELQKFKEYEYLQKSEKLETERISIAGRILLKRESGNIIFYTLSFEQQDIQIICMKQYYQDFKSQHKLIKTGDIVGFQGFIGKSNTNHLSIFATEHIILAKGQDNTIAKSWITREGILKNNFDNSIKYSQRYLDLINNKESYNVFITRSKIIKYIRNYFDDREFFEVETPILSDNYSGANATPFLTLHKYLQRNMYLRIAPELYLKKLIIGGFHRVYEIGKQFRNENIDSTHNPEFTSMEFYIAYQDYNYLMDFTEKFLSSLVHHLYGKYNVNFINQYGESFSIDFSPPYRRIDMLSELQKNIGEFPDTLESEKTRQFLLDQCLKYNIDCPIPHTINRLLDRLVKHFLENQCINPTFIINHPLLMSPLAKEHRDFKGLTERFELFVAKMELCNAYTELNSPQEQYNRFIQQQQDKENGDDEAQTFDKDFITALTHGMPPTAGFGMGIDRLVMLLTNNKYIKDVILYPQI